MFCAASATQAANWVPLDTVAEDAPLVRTNHDDSEDGSNSAVICNTPPYKEGGGIKGGGRRIGFIGKNGKCKTVGRGTKVRKIEEDSMVLLDDHHVPGSTYEPATMAGDHDEIGPGGPAPVDHGGRGVSFDFCRVCLCRRLLRTTLRAYEYCVQIALSGVDFAGHRVWTRFSAGLASS